MKKTDNVNIKPKEVDIKSEDELMLSPHRQTGTSDQGDKKDSEGDRTLNNFNTAIPSSPAVGEKSPAVEKGTARYLPKQ